MIETKRLSAIIKEGIKLAIIILILSNIINYFRKPEFVLNHLPNIDANMLDGGVYTFKESKPILIHFWALWCPVCKIEIGNIEYISKYYEVLTVVVDSGDDSKISEFMKKRGLGFVVINDKDGKLAKRFQVEVYPTTFIYDANKELLFSEVGYTTTAGLMARLKLSEQ